MDEQQNIQPMQSDFEQIKKTDADESSLDLLRMAMERLKLSARAYNRI